ncbi:hypothetical protein [Gordonia sp. MP11Mi]|uniref:Mce-associated membrane protein n=1 Tax=Gordonia sp. MP11Mi TaxID=3022769 RepID=A0AA97CXR0_9ACTN
MSEDNTDREKTEGDDAGTPAETTVTETAKTVTPAAESAVTPAAESAVTPAAESAVTPAAESAVTPAAESAVTPAAESAAEKSDGKKSDETLTQKNDRGSGRRGQVTMSIPVLIGSLLAGLLIIILAATTVVFVLRDSSARNDLDSMRATAADAAAAEKVAGKYAVSAATLDYQDLTPWITAMKKGVSPELAKRYDAVGQTMEQIITPLRMKTSGELVTTSLSDSEGDLYRVDAVVNVNTTTVQNPSGGNAVAVYKLTLDRSKNWLITEVGDPTNTVAGNLGSPSGAPAAPAAPAAPTPPADQVPGN